MGNPVKRTVYVTTGHRFQKSDPWMLNCLSCVISYMKSRHMNMYIWMFPKIGVPKIDGLSWKTQLKWMIWGYHYFWKHPYIYIYIYICMYNSPKSPQCIGNPLLHQKLMLCIQQVTGIQWKCLTPITHTVHGTSLVYLPIHEWLTFIGKCK